MADVAGLVIGVVSLAGVVENCVTFIDYISAARCADKAAQVQCVRADIQKARLLDWTERVRILGPNPDPRFGNASLYALVQKTLESLQSLLDDTDGLRKRYGLAESGSAHHGSNQQPPVLVAERRGAKFLRQIQKLPISEQDRSKPMSNSRSYKWAVRDKDKFRALVDDIVALVDGLEALFPDTAVQNKPPQVPSKQDLETIKTAAQMEVLSSALAAGGRELSKDAITHQKKLLKEAHERVLDRLWFRVMDDRHSSIDPAHAKTFEWALSQDQDQDFSCDLASWLRQGQNLYWIKGKPGSGKSCLLKFLFGHPKTEVLLKEWSGGARLVIVNHFFWALGSPDQKSQNGLLRALLHKILAASPALAPKLLPHTWREEFYLDRSQSEPPSETEMREAFSELAKLTNTKWKMCIFLDGLDEFDGDLRRSILMFQRLVDNPNIKILLSSRPIVPCLVAFKSCPQFRMQDLTHGDMKLYVQDKITTHPYLLQLEGYGEGTGAILLDSLLTKACGVFLWLVLACRSLLDGFDEFATLTDLRARLDELPPELEDLFRHILSYRIDRRYSQLCAKYVRLIYENQAAMTSPGILAVSLARFVERDLSLDTPMPTGYAAQSFRGSLDTQLIFEVRLSNYCGGLLEVSKPKDVHLEDDRKYVGGGYTVNFMHRTMFEFLVTPGVLRLDCLRIHDTEFDPHAVLTFLHLDRASIEDAEESAKTLEAVLNHTSLATKQSFSDLQIMSGCVRKTSTADATGKDPISSISNYNYHHPSVTPGKITLAVEAGLVPYLRAACNQPNLDRMTGGSLLYHALFAPTLCKAAKGHSTNFPHLLETVKLLVGLGVTSDTIFEPQPGHGDSLWLSWIHKCENVAVASKEHLLDITEVLLEAATSRPLPEEHAITDCITKLALETAPHGPEERISSLIDLVQSKSWRRTRSLTEPQSPPHLDDFIPLPERLPEHFSRSSTPSSEEYAWGSQRERELRSTAPAEEVYPSKDTWDEDFDIVGVSTGVASVTLDDSDFEEMAAKPISIPGSGAQPHSRSSAKRLL